VLREVVHAVAEFLWGGFAVPVAGRLLGAGTHCVVVAEVALDDFMTASAGPTVPAAPATVATVPTPAVATVTAAAVTATTVTAVARRVVTASTVAGGRRGSAVTLRRVVTGRFSVVWAAVTAVVARRRRRSTIVRATITTLRAIVLAGRRRGSGTRQVVEVERTHALRIDIGLSRDVVRHASKGSCRRGIKIKSGLTVSMGKLQ
jgi:hypothetical protein